MHSLSSVHAEMIKMIYWLFLIILMITIAQCDMECLSNWRSYNLFPCQIHYSLLKLHDSSWLNMQVNVCVCVLSPGQMCVQRRRWSLWPRCSRVSRPSLGWLKPGNKDARDNPGAWATRGGGTDIHTPKTLIYVNINIMSDQSTIQPLQFLCYIACIWCVCKFSTCMHIQMTLYSWVMYPTMQCAQLFTVWWMNHNLFLILLKKSDFF